MNVSDKHKLLWFANHRTASRAIASIIYDQLEFKNIYNLDSSIYTHEVLYDHEKYSDYKIILCIRNPYSKYVSVWQLMKDEYQTFEQYIFSDYNWTDVENITISICKKYNRNIEYLIRYENLDVDILQLPYKLDFDSIKTNYFKSDIKRIDDGKYSDYKSYYTQQLADIVYERNQNIFEFFGYERDSWKYL